MMRPWMMKVIAVGIAVLVDGGGAGILRGEAPPEKPPLQRLLQGAEATKATELEGRVQAAWRAGKWDEALRAAGELLELRQKVQGKGHWEVVNVRWHMEALRAVQRQTEEVQKEYLTLPEHQRQADALLARGQYWEAQPLLEKVLAIRRKVLGEEHPDTATSYNNLSLSLNPQRKYAAAEAGYKKALDIYRKTLGEEHPSTATSYTNLAGNLNAQGKYAAAEESYKKALAIRRKVLGKEHPSTATS